VTVHQAEEKWLDDQWSRGTIFTRNWTCKGMCSAHASLDIIPMQIEDTYATYLICIGNLSNTIRAQKCWQHVDMMLPVSTYCQHCADMLSPKCCWCHHHMVLETSRISHHKNALSYAFFCYLVLYLGLHFAKETSQYALFWMIAQAKVLVQFVALTLVQKCSPVCGQDKHQNQHSTLLKRA